MLKRRKRSIVLRGLPNELLAHCARLYPEFEWVRESVPMPASDKAVGVMRLKEPWTSLCLAPFPYSLLPSFVRRGWLKPLNEALPPEFRSQYASKALQLASYGRDLYALPDDVTAFMLVVDDFRLRKHGFAAPRTWADLELQWKYFARSRREPFAAIEGKGLPGVTRFFGALLGSNGVNPGGGWEKLPDHKDGYCEAYDFLLRLLAAGPAPGPLIMPDRFYQSMEEADKQFIYWFTDTGLMTRLPRSLWQRLRAVPFPRGPSCAGEPYRWCAGGGWVVPHNTIAPDLAFDLLKLVRTVDFAKNRDLSGEGYAFPAPMPLWKDRRLLDKFPFYAHAEALLNSGHIIEPAALDAAFLSRLAETVEQGLQEIQPPGIWWKRLLACGRNQAHGEIAGGLFGHAVAYIDSHVAEVHDTQQVAASIKRSVRQVNRLFRKQYGMTCPDYLKKQRMERARDLLANLSLSIKEVAVAVGIRNTSSFSRMFRNYWGLSPVLLRRRAYRVLEHRETDAV